MAAETTPGGELTDATLMTLVASLQALQSSIAGTAQAMASAMTANGQMLASSLAVVKNLEERVTQHSMKCVFSPERDGEGPRVLARITALEEQQSEVNGALGVVKWMGFGTLVAVMGLSLKALIGG